jgi:hypothetical protein
MTKSAPWREKIERAWDWLNRDLPPALAPYSDPGRSEAWWWLGTSLFVAVAAPIVYALNPLFYNKNINREGWGALEFLHVVIPLAALILAINLLRDPLVYRSIFLRVWIGVAALGALYIAGEEASWGQHLIGWDTPESWQGVNDQNETNLHNISSWLDQKPRLLMQLGIIVGGIILPIVLPYWRTLQTSRVALIIPPIALMPTALLALVYYVLDDLKPLMPDSSWIVTRPAEVEETFLVLFVLFYLVVLKRRLAEVRSTRMESAELGPAKA